MLGNISSPREWSTQGTDGARSSQLRQLITLPGFTRIYQDPSMKIAVMDGHRQGKKANAYKYPLTFLK